MTGGFRQVGSFETGPVSAVGVGPERVAVAREESVDLVAGADRLTVDPDEPIIDVALTDRLSLLTDEAIHTYDRAGEHLWTKPVDAHALAAVPREDLLVALSPETVHGLAVSSGQDRFSADRTVPGRQEDDVVVGTRSGFALASWSLLCGYEADGSQGFERTLDAAIRSLGHYDHGLVLALQNDHLACFDPVSGDHQWDTHLEVSHVAPAGGDDILVSTADGIRRIDEDGATEPVSTLAGERLYPSRNGSICCSIRDGTAATYVHSSAELSVAVPTGSAGVGGTIDVQVRNPTDRDRSIDLEAAIDGASLAPATRSLTVEAGASETVDFPVETVDREGERPVRIEAAGTVLAEETVELTDAATGSIAVDVDLAATTIAGDTASLTARIRNDGGVPLESVTLLEADHTGTDIDPGETWTATVTRPFEPDSRVSVGLEVSTAQRTRQFAPTCQLPSEPELTIEAQEAAARATISTAPAVTLEDQLVIEVPGAGRVRTPITVDTGQLLVVVPCGEDGIVRVALDGAGIEDRVEVTAGGPFRVPGGDTPPSDPPVPPHEDIETDVDPLDVVRAITPDRPTIGQVVTDRIELTARESLEDVDIQVGDDVHTVEAISADDRLVLSRSLVRTEPGEWTPPAARITAGSDVVETVQGQPIQVLENDLAVLATLDPEADALHLEFENAATESVSIETATVEDRPHDVAVTLEPNGAETATVPVEDVSAHPTPTPVTLSVTGPGTDDRTVETLAPVVSPATPEPSSPLSVSISPQTCVAGEYGSAVLELEHTGDTPVTGLTVEAAGSAINDEFYSTLHRDEFRPDERLEHFVDLDVPPGETQFEATVTYQDGGDTVTFQVTAAGPARADTEEWSEDDSGDWTVERSAPPAETATPSPPQTIVTAFRSTEPGLDQEVPSD